MRRIVLLVLTLGLMLNGLQSLLLYQLGALTHIIHELDDHYFALQTDPHEHPETANFSLRYNQFGNIVVAHSHANSSQSSQNQNEPVSHEHIFFSVTPLIAIFAHNTIYDLIQIGPKKINISFSYLQTSLPLAFISQILRPPIQ